MTIAIVARAFDKITIFFMDVASFLGLGGISHSTDGCSAPGRPYHSNGNGNTVQDGTENAAG